MAKRRKPSKAEYCSKVCHQRASHIPCCEQVSKYFIYFCKSLTTGCEEVLIFLKLCLLYVDVCVVRDWLELTSWLSGDVFNKDLIWS